MPRRATTRQQAPRLSSLYTYSLRPPRWLHMLPNPWQYRVGEMDSLRIAWSVASRQQLLDRAATRDFAVAERRGVAGPRGVADDRPSTEPVRCPAPKAGINDSPLPLSPLLLLPSLWHLHLRRRHWERAAHKDARPTLA